MIPIGMGRRMWTSPLRVPSRSRAAGRSSSASSGSISSEVVWHDGANDGTGGGVSRFFALPSYQQLAGVPPAADPAGPVMRGVPDVSGDAAPASGYRIVCDGTSFPDPSQGTSSGGRHQRCRAPLGRPRCATQSRVEQAGRLYQSAALRCARRTRLSETSRREIMATTRRARGGTPARGWAVPTGKTCFSL